MPKIQSKKRLQLFTRLILFAAIGFAAACSSRPGNAIPTQERLDPGPEECQDRVLVVVWGDLDGDGIQDPDEPTQADVLLAIAPHGDPENRAQRSTGENGSVSFPTRELENCRPFGYQVIFLRQVAGYKFPLEPVVDLAGFDPIKDVVRFGLRPVAEADR